VSCGTGKLREVLAWLRADADAGVLAFGYETRDAVVMTLGCNQHVIEAPSPGFQRLGYRMDAVENFHVSSLDGLERIVPSPLVLCPASSGYFKAILDGARCPPLATFYCLGIEDAEEVVLSLR
jgi:hypothetical protein